MNVLMINGSPRVNGNTAIALREMEQIFKLEGIDCYALPNATHIWTVATLDGETVHIDATWGDQGNTGTKQYFAMTPEQSYALHPWPKENELPQ